MSTPGSNTPDRSRQRHWGLAIFVLALLLPSVIVNLRNPTLSPTLRLLWLGQLTLIVVFMVGFALYGISRARRQGREDSRL